MARNKPRLYVALYIRSREPELRTQAENKFDWTLVVGPKEESPRSTYTLHRLQAVGTSECRYEYEKVQLNTEPDQMLLFRVLVGKDRTEWGLETYHWVMEVLKAMLPDGRALGHSAEDWNEVWQAVMRFAWRREEAHRAGGRDEYTCYRYFRRNPPQTIDVDTACLQKSREPQHSSDIFRVYRSSKPELCIIRHLQDLLLGLKSFDDEGWAEDFLFDYTGFGLRTRVASALPDSMYESTVSLCRRLYSGENWVVSDQGSAPSGCANVAGITQAAFSKEQPAMPCETNDEWSRILGVNINGIMYCTRAQVRAMLKLPKGSNPAIVNVSSLASLIQGPTAFAYGASKAACAHFTACVAKDIHPFGIRANIVSPSNTFTPLTKVFFGNLTKEETELKLQSIDVPSTMLDPSDIAQVIFWLLSASSVHINGVNIPVGEGAP
ncbi:hypothetical protein F4808DRAFT_457589 [Astrocystis sublimbata]|nr:hypothetical protein F4808DRAFT_457589 [Astrocystis sublimbata]